MTSNAALPAKVIVIHPSANPCGGVMAVFTRIIGLQVSRGLTFRRYIVMARSAAAMNLVVIDIQNRAPRQRVMTGFALRAAIDMGVVFCRSVIAIVTADARLAANRAVVELRQPGIGGMTIIAASNCGDMV